MGVWLEVGVGLDGDVVGLLDGVDGVVLLDGVVGSGDVFKGWDVEGGGFVEGG